MMPLLPVVVSLLAILLATLRPEPTSQEDSDVEVAGPIGHLEYRITGPDEALIPARLTVMSSEIDLVALAETSFGERYAVRENVCYSLDGRGRLTLPAGEFELVATRGIEWTIDRRTVTIEAGGNQKVEFRIAPAVDTTGMIGGDFHLHTLTHSGHGDSNMPERIVSLAGEGVELAIATDHNRNIDYGPTIRALDAEDTMTAMVGNEVSTPIGHFNAFPLDPDRSPVPDRIPAAPPLFRLIRLEPNALGVPPIIQVNHPRWNGIDYFSQSDLDETTGSSESPRWSADFDAIEVLNENCLWGWFAPEDSPPSVTRDNTHSAMLDWYALLDTGHRAVATGNSDSHSVKANFAGVPRNYVASSTDDPSKIDAAEAVAAIRRGDVVVSSGPIVRALLRDRPITDEPRRGIARGGEVLLDLEVQAAPWIDCDRIRIVLDGDVVQTIPVPQTRDRIRFEGMIRVPMTNDGWIVILVDGADPIEPLVFGKSRPVLPVAIVNPFRIDADEDGEWTAPLRRVAVRTAGLRPTDVDAEWDASRPSERRRMVASTRTKDGVNSIDSETARRIVALGLAATANDHRLVRLAACRAVDGDSRHALAVEAVIVGPKASDRTIGAAVAALASIDPDRLNRRLPDLIDQRGPAMLRDLGTVRLDAVAGPTPRTWLVSGPHERVEDLGSFALSLAENTRSLPVTRNGSTGWEKKRPRPNGLLSFKELSADPEDAVESVAVATGWIISPRDMIVPIAFGSDDGAVVVINGAVIHEDRTTHGANPFAELLRAPLRAGANRVVIAVENGTGDFGFHFRPLNREVEIRTTPDEQASP